MTTISQSTIDFLENIGRNNSKEWFQSNKKDWEKAKDNFTDFLTDLLHQINEKENIHFDEPKKYLGRINRDIRFSNDKRPYNDYITSMIFRDGAKSTTPFYIRIQHGHSLIGAGVKSPDGALLKKIRQEIDVNGDELQAILTDQVILEAFGPLEGDALKRPPKGFDANHPHLNLLLQKDFLLTREISNDILLSPEFLTVTLKAFQTALPFMRFMDRAILEQ
jgi:uncharacterized protein (TIGR02453 family)